MRAPELPASTILLCEVGSTAHGTGLEGYEDHDEAGVVVESPETVLGPQLSDHVRMWRSASEGQRSGPGDTDRTLYPLRHFLRLCSDGNPSVLLAFWAPVIESSPLGEALRREAEAFVGRHALARYRGYLQGQVHRMCGTRGGGHGRRGSGGRPELIERFGYDTKYAMNAARLGMQGAELVTTGRLRLPMQGPEADWLRAVRRGEVPFKEWWARCVQLDAELERLQRSPAIRPGPDQERIRRLGVELHLRAWGLGEQRSDLRPHSRACGPWPHPHGSACSRNCPSCHGRDGG